MMLLRFCCCFFCSSSLLFMKSASPLSEQKELRQMLPPLSKASFLPYYQVLFRSNIVIPDIPQRESALLKAHAAAGSIRGHVAFEKKKDQAPGTSYSFKCEAIFPSASVKMMKELRFCCHLPNLFLTDRIVKVFPSLLLSPQSPP